MAGRQKPVGVLIAEGKSHYSKDYLALRKSLEVTAETDSIVPSDFLPARLHNEFNRYVYELMRMNIIGNVDADTLSWYLVHRDEWERLTKKYNAMEKDSEVAIDDLKKVFDMKSRAAEAASREASKLGLNVTSRCKLVVPKLAEEKVNKFDKFSGDGNG